MTASVTDSKNKYGVDRAQFKVPGKKKTRGLFSETNQNEVLDPAPYCLSAVEPAGKVSIRRVYMDCADPSEYDFAHELLGDWSHWELLKETEWFKPVLASMRAELHAKLQSDGIKKYRSLADRGEVTAAKWFAEKGFVPKDKAEGKRGRPPKQSGSSSTEAMSQSEVDILLGRVGLKD